MIYMITRELFDDDYEAVLELAAACQTGCGFKSLEEAAALWARWRLVATLLGSFDDQRLVSLRVIEILGDDVIRLRAQFHRDPMDAGLTEELRRAARGFVAWCRHHGITRVVVPPPPGPSRGEWYGVKAELQAAELPDGAFEYTVDRLEEITRA